MCNKSGLEFGQKYLTKEEIHKKDVLEVGSLNVNGSLRSHAMQFSPSRYIGVDIIEGKGVDSICNSEELVSRFGSKSFDVVITTEMMEHVQNWRLTISNLKNVLKIGGILLLTTRSKGYKYHCYPYDYWRYEIDDMKIIFSDFEILVLEKDSLSPGVFGKFRKPIRFVENDLSKHELYRIEERKK